MRRRNRKITDNKKRYSLWLLPSWLKWQRKNLKFGFAKENKKYIFYFHDARIGRKFDIIKQNNYVGFELDTNHKIYTKGDKACNYTAKFQSVIGNGKVEIIEDSQEKMKALLELMKKNTGKKMSCKEHEWGFTGKPKGIKNGKV